MELAIIPTSVWAGLGTLAGTAIILVARDLRDGKSILKKNGTAESNRTMRELSEGIKRIGESQNVLKSHFNDDTTRILEEIVTTLKDHNQMENQVLSSIRDMKVQLDQFEKFGVPQRRS